MINNFEKMLNLVSAGFRSSESEESSSIFSTPLAPGGGDTSSTSCPPQSWTVKKYLNRDENFKIVDIEINA